MSDAQVHDSVIVAPATDGMASTMRERVVVSPTAGRFRALPDEEFTTEGEWVERGETVGEIDKGQDLVPVRCDFQGWVMGALAVHGQPVTEGEALLWIRRP